jgi:hypothetical protein
MKLVYVVLCVIALLATTDSAHARNWRRAKGKIYLTRYEDTTGKTLSDLPPPREGDSSKYRSPQKLK